MFKKLVGLLTVAVAGLVFSSVASAQITTTAHDFSGTGWAGGRREAPLAAKQGHPRRDCRS